MVDEDRQQRAATVLRNVAYVIEARLELSARGLAAADENVGKHLDMFRRRARKGQCFHRPCLGTREFAADFELVEGEPPAVDPELIDGKVRDLGWMVHDNHYPGQEARFFRAAMRDGVIEVPPLNAPGVVA
jgi:CRISPR-associated protein Cas5d